MVIDFSPLSTPFGDPHDPIIIVDDDPNDTFLLRRALMDANIHHPAVTFSDVRRAIDYLEYLSKEAPSLVPGLVCTDLDMTPVDGFKLIAWLRQHRQFRKVPIAAFSDSESASEANKALELGANLCVEKFPPPAKLRAMLLESAT
jgi:CheY-like chemotaxis protein